VAAGNAQQERRALADLFLQLGPDAPTLCEGWRTADLAAHLVARERRPDAALGIVFAPLAGHTERVQRAVRDGRSWPDLVALVRDGPPWPFRLGPVDAAMNTAELFVHHEDVRRARPGWEPRASGESLERALWSRVRLMARAARRAAPPGLVLVSPGFGRVEVRPGTPQVAATGAPGELLLLLFGRQEAARVALDGEPAAVEQVRTAPFGV
jgi:uncharacterized protein (TIGR03085 family)